MNSILVRSPNWIGDQILAYPFFHYLRAAFPKARITAACAPWVEAVQFRNLVDEVVVMEKPGSVRLWAKIKAVEASAKRARRDGGFDLGICLPDSASSAWFLLRAGARARRGYHSDGRGILLTEGVTKPLHVVHRAEAYQRLLPASVPPPKRDVMEFWGVPPVDDLDPGVPGVVAEFDAERAWPDAEPVAPPSGDYWVLAPGATADSRRWPVERFVELCRQIKKDTGLRAVIVGGVPEVRLAMKITEELGPQAALDRVAQGPVSGLWKLFRGAKFTVANDSGLAHVASLCGSPVHIVWGAGDPKRTQPIGPGKVRMSLNPVECWPCERNQCSLPPAQKVQCLKGIHPDSVWEEIRRGLKPV